MNDIERRMMLNQDETAKLELFLGELRNNTLPSKEEAGKKAAERVRKFHPIHGDPDDISQADGEDRPLPYELKDRINVYIEERINDDPVKYKQDIEEASSFNALVRKEIRAGKI